MLRRFPVLALVLVVLMLVSACSSAQDRANDGSDDAYSPPYSDTDELREDVTGNVRHVIYEAWLRVSVENVNDAVDQLSRRANAIGGYVSNSVRDNNPDMPEARVTYRIPQAEYQGFLSYAGSLGEAERESVRSTDVTEEYVDLEARLVNRQLHEERMLAMFAQAKTIDELITIEKELARIREEIERLQGRMRYLSDNVAMSTIEIFLVQTPGETQVPGLGPVGLSETLRRALRALVLSSTMFLDVLSFLVVALFALLPFAIPIGLVAFFILRRRRRNKNQKIVS